MAKNNPTSECMDLLQGETYRPGFYYGAGPAMLPTPVLAQIRQELFDWQHTGVSILEIGHRSAEFKALLQRTLDLVRSLLLVPEGYQIFFMAGAARNHFSLIPENFLGAGEQGAYWVTGFWSQLAFNEANTFFSAKQVGPDEPTDATYLYYTPNETIDGVRVDQPKRQSEIPLIADMTSCLFSESIQVKDYAFIFAGAQKNIANAGLTLLIARDEMLTRSAQHKIPAMQSYDVQAAHQSLYATPPVFNIYVAEKVLQWVQKEGGLAHFDQLNQWKSKKLYDFIDQSAAYQCRVETALRSRVNVCFDLVDSSKTQLFLDEAQKNQFYGLAGHQRAGGLRASLYNAMPMAGVDALIDFMTYFAEECLP